MSKIKSLEAREIIDSRGNPTVEVSCVLVGGSVGVASVPSGASTGSHEAFDLRDGDQKRFGGLGVQKAVRNIREVIAKEVVGVAVDQASLDKKMIDLDGTENKSRLGANAILGVSLAFARAASVERGIQLYEYLGGLGGRSRFVMPQPMCNVINGGKHADSGLDIQEFMIGPVGIIGFERKIQAVSEIIHSLRENLHSRGYSISVGDEGGFAPKLSSNEEAFDCIVAAIKAAGYSQQEIKIGIDAAASSFYSGEGYHLKISGSKKNVTPVELLSWYKKLIDTYQIVSIEDGFHEEDWEHFSSMTKEIGEKIVIVGDDLTVTNTTRIKLAIKEGAINSVLIKPNQIGTVSETIDAVLLTQNQGWSAFASHRSGETTDTFIADLAVGLGCEYIKAGSLIRGERVCKYNRLLEISMDPGISP